MTKTYDEIVAPAQAQMDERLAAEQEKFQRAGLAAEAKRERDIAPAKAAYEKARTAATAELIQTMDAEREKCTQAKAAHREAFKGYRARLLKEAELAGQTIET